MSQNPEYRRYSAGWWGDAALKCGVFAVAGSSSMYAVRPVMSQVFGLRFSLDSWTDMLATPVVYMLTMTPCYTVILVSVGCAIACPSRVVFH